MFWFGFYCGHIFSLCQQIFSAKTGRVLDLAVTCSPTLVSVIAATRTSLLRGLGVPRRSFETDIG
jgi:hypothetical protein